VSEPILTVANQLTLLRLTLVPAVVALVLSAQFTWALVVFVVAGVTDLLDGLIARLGHQKTTLGAFLDPVADKVLLSSSFIALTWASELHVRIPAWLTVTTLSRDAIILIAVAAINLTYGRKVFLPSLLGKLSTASQVVTAGVVLLLNALIYDFPPLLYLFLLTLALAVASGVHYVYLASLPKGSHAQAAVHGAGKGPADPD
jgi:cardiolipin synthase (CMP-forming)